MECLKQTLPELRYLYYHMNRKERNEYIQSASPKLMQCLNEIVINLLYSHKNGLNLSKNELKKLSPYKNAMKKIVLSKSVSAKRKLLKNSLLEILLSTILAIVSDRDLEN